MSRKRRARKKSVQNSRLWVVAALLGIVVISAVVVMLSRSNEPATVREVAMAPLEEMPDFVRNGPTEVQEAYRFAIANQDLLNQIPCYCGCVHVGHGSNLDCYIREVQPDGTIVFDDHAYP